MPKRFFRAIRRILGAHRQPQSIEALWKAQRDALAAAMMIVRVFYLCLFFIISQTYPTWASWLRRTELRLIWPVAWFRYTGTHAGVAIVLTLAIAGALLAATWPTNRFCRLIAAVGILEFAAFFNSFGDINHGWHVWIWTAILFVLLPSGTRSSMRFHLVRRQRYLRLFWSAQAAVLGFYSLSGAMKLVGAAIQLRHGQASAFAPDALARHIAYRLEEGMLMDASMFGATIIQHPYLGWPFHLAAMYLEVFSILIAFRPQAHRAWGLMLLLLHVGIYLTMTIMFAWQMLLVGLLFLCSPFAPERSSIKSTIRALPIIGDAIAWKTRRI